LGYASLKMVHWLKPGWRIELRFGSADMAQRSDQFLVYFQKQTEAAALEMSASCRWRKPVDLSITLEANLLLARLVDSDPRRRAKYSRRLRKK
jgi:predicted transcriptional regulator